RFRLVMHKETREIPVYALVVVKGGSKLKPAPRDTDCPMGVPCSRARGGPATGFLLPDADMRSILSDLLCPPCGHRSHRHSRPFRDQVAAVEPARHVGYTANPR